MRAYAEDRACCHFRADDMELLTVNHSSYPRIGSTPEEQILRRTLTQRGRGEKADADVRAAEDHLVSLALQDQQDTDIDVVTDRLIRWNDPVSHPSSLTSVMEILKAFIPGCSISPSTISTSKCRTADSIFFDCSGSLHSLRTSATAWSTLTPTSSKAEDANGGRSH